jgi:hypothetical protein
MRREPWPDALALPSLELLEPRLLLAGPSGSVDLMVTEVTVPGSARLGEGFEVTWTVKNQGPDGALGSWTDAVYFSDDLVLNLPQGEEDAGDYQLVSTISEGLAADQTYTVTFWVGLPYYGSGGTCYLLFVADVDDNVPEANESNNILAAPMDIIPPDVDLEVTAAAAPESVRLSDSFDVSWTVTNQGSEDVWEYWQDMIFYSADSVLDPGDVRLGYGGGGGEGLRGGETYDSNATVSLPGGLPAGPAYLLIVTDGTRRIPETDEANNTFDLPITVTLPDVDLQVTGAAAPPSGLLGGAVSVSWTVKNFGAEEAVADWYDSIYVSSDATFDPGDVLAGYVWIEGQTPLAGGASYTIDNMSVSIPNGAPTGAVYLLFVADRGYYADIQNYQGETDETNNVVARPITLTPPDVDLVITSTTAPATVLVGQYLTVSWTGTNQGGAATQQSYWYDSVYYSEDAVLDKRDVLLAYGSVSRAVLPGGTYAVSDIPIQIPATTPTGTHYLLFVADGYNYQAETDEANNVLAVPVAVEQPAADLAITDGAGRAAGLPLVERRQPGHDLDDGPTLVRRGLLFRRRRAGRIRPGDRLGVHLGTGGGGRRVRFRQHHGLHPRDGHPGDALPVPESGCLRLPARDRRDEQRLPRRDQRGVGGPGRQGGDGAGRGDPWRYDQRELDRRQPGGRRRHQLVRRRLPLQDGLLPLRRQRHCHLAPERAPGRPRGPRRRVHPDAGRDAAQFAVRRRRVLPALCGGQGQRTEGARRDE